MAMNTSVVLYDPQETSAEVKAVAGFLAGYSGRTREAYTLDEDDNEDECKYQHRPRGRIPKSLVRRGLLEFFRHGLHGADCPQSTPAHLAIGVSVRQRLMDR